VVINLNGPPQYEFINLAIDSIVWGIFSFILMLLISWIGTALTPASPSVTQANSDRNVGHTQRRAITGVFVILGIASVMKLTSEFVHEVVGHGLLALLFGGRIVSVHLAWLWPYQLSSIQISGTFTEWQRLWIDSGGILSCLITSSLCQLILYRRMTSRRMAIPLFWLAFWTFVNPVGYLILGGFHPFGDVALLIAQGVLSPLLSLGLGALFFTGGFISLSRIAINILHLMPHHLTSSRYRMLLSTLWLILPFVTTMAIIGLKFLSPSAVLLVGLSSLPSLVVYLFPKHLLFTSAPTYL
jgi:hypothetical protein